MKTISLENKIAQAGLPTMMAVSGSNQVYVIGKNGKTGSYFFQEGKAVCVSTFRNGQEGESHTFHKSIKSFIQALV